VEFPLVGGPWEFFGGGVWECPHMNVWMGSFLIERCCSFWGTLLDGPGLLPMDQ